MMKMLLTTFVRNALQFINVPIKVNRLTTWELENAENFFDEFLVFDVDIQLRINFT